MFTKKNILKLVLRVVIHGLFWCAVLLFFTFFFSAGSSNQDDAVTFALFLMPITMATTYVSIYKLIPEYLVTKRYRLFTLYSVYSFIISLYLIMMSIFFSLTYLANFEYDQMNPVTRNILLVTTGVYSVTIIASAFKLLKLNLKNAEKTKNLETKILDTQLKLKEQELNYLKMQIQPHFLFNTLNTMYGFALKKADETPEMILKLSNLLDYLLYEVDKPQVLLTKEVQHINDYISLEQLRFSDRLDVSFYKDLIPEGQTIAPMLLLPFIENSFKHGSIIKEKLKVDISLRIDSNSIHFTVKNSSLESKSKNAGIGLKNVKKRLDLLYPEKHIFSVNQVGNYFIADLKLFNHEY